MSTLTLADAETYLSNARTALDRAVNAKSVGDSDRQIARHDLKDLRENVAYWERRVSELSNTADESPGVLIAKWD